MIGRGLLVYTVQQAAVGVLCRHWLVERPNHTYAHWYLGRASYLQERWDEALQAFETAKRISPDDKGGTF